MLHCVARINRSTNRKCGESQWRRDHWKAKDATRAAIKNGKDTTTIRWQQDELRWPTDGLTANIWITSRRLMLTTWPRGNKDTDTKVLFHRPWLQQIVNAEPWMEEVITNPLRMLSSVLGKNKEDNILFRKTRDQGKDHSTKNCKRYYDGWVKMGWLISRNVHPLDHLRKIGGHMNTNIKTLDGTEIKTLNDEITNGKIINSKIMFGLKI